MVETIVLVVVGFLVALVNSLAGGGSSLSIPVLLLLGVPAGIANGSNRFGVLAGNLSSFWALKNQLRVSNQHKIWILWAMLGAAIGAFVATLVPDLIFKPLLALVVVSIVVVQFFPQSKLKSTWEPGNQAPLLFIGVGFYAGFVQIGLGYILMYVLGKTFTTDILKINAMKSLLGFCLISLSFVVFWVLGQVSWNIALPLALGGLLGGYSGGCLQGKISTIRLRYLISGLALLMALKILYFHFWV
jgi:hypothetical protein